MATFDFSLNPTDFSGPVRRAQEEQLMLRQRRNALAQQEQGMADQARFRNALTTGGVNAAAQVDPVAAQPYVQQQDAQRAKALHGVAAKAWGIYISPAPKVAAQAQGLLESFAQESGKPLEALTDDDVRVLARQDAEKAIAASGLDPRQFKEPEAAQDLTIGTSNIGGFDVLTQGGRIVNSRAPRQPTPGGGGRSKPPSGYDWMTDPQTGDSVLGPIPGGPADPNRPQPPKPASPQEAKARRDAQMKIPTIDATDRRLARISAAVESLAKNRFADGGPLDQAALIGSKQAQEMENASAQLMPTLTALTRVPGIGSQSDLEARLAALQLPSTKFAPEVNRAAVKELQQFMKDLRAAYMGLASGASAAAAPAAGGWSIEPVQ